MSVSYEGFNMNALTFHCSSKINKGMAVKINKSDSVVPCADGDVFHGFAVEGDDKYVAGRAQCLIRVQHPQQA